MLFRCVLLVTALLYSSFACAALPPYYQRQAEFERILAAARVKEALQSQPVEAIERTGEDTYRVYGGNCAVVVRIIDLPMNAMVGPRRFDLEVGEADCGR